MLIISFILNVLKLMLVLLTISNTKFHLLIVLRSVTSPAEQKIQLWNLHILLNVVLVKQQATPREDYIITLG